MEVENHDLWTRRVSSFFDVKRVVQSMIDFTRQRNIDHQIVSMNGLRESSVISFSLGRQAGHTSALRHLMDENTKSISIFHSQGQRNRFVQRFGYDLDDRCLTVSKLKNERIYCNPRDIDTVFIDATCAFSISMIDEIMEFCSTIHRGNNGFIVVKLG